MLDLPAVTPCRPETRCKVCGGVAQLYGVVDFNKNCEELRGKFLPLRGIAVSVLQFLFITTRVRNGSFLKAFGLGKRLGIVKPLE